jgi:hypothetical protein
VDKLAGLPLPEEAMKAAESSMAAALMVAEQAPTEGRGLVLAAAQDAFQAGWTSACIVAAAVALAGAVLAALFLPNRAA